MFWEQSLAVKQDVTLLREPGSYEGGLKLGQLGRIKLGEPLKSLEPRRQSAGEARSDQDRAVTRTDGRLSSAHTGAAGLNKGRARESSCIMPVPFSLESERQLVHPWHVAWWLGAGSGGRDPWT